MKNLGWWSMVRKFSVLLILVLLTFITGCANKQSAQNIELPKATAIKHVAAIYGENNPEIVRTNNTTEETSKKPMYTVFLKGNFYKGSLHANNLEFSMMANGEKVWALRAFNDNHNKDIWEDADIEILNSPDKIIIFGGGKSKEITSKDKEFNKIVSLTNSRFNIEGLTTEQDGGDINGKVNQKKKTALATEFIYYQEQAIDVNSIGFVPIRYYRLFFELRDDLSSAKPGGIGNTAFQYGDKYTFKDSSRGPIKESQELVILLDSIIRQ